MAEFRAGHDAAAVAAFLQAEQAAETNNWHPELRPFVVQPSWFYRAMMRYRQGQEPAAKALFQEAAAQMPPLPANAAHVLPLEVDQNQLLCWLAYREAVALLKLDPAPKLRRYDHEMYHDKPCKIPRLTENLPRKYSR